MLMSSHFSQTTQISTVFYDALAKKLKPIFICCVRGEFRQRKMNPIGEWPHIEKSVSNYKVKVALPRLLLSLHHRMCFFALRTEKQTDI